MPTLLLASASPARLGTLRAAGIEPLVAVSAVDEPAVLAAAAADAAAAGRGPVPAAEQVLLLARAKARDVAAHAPLAATADLVLGCDSMLEIDPGTGPVVVGKPRDAADAVARWRAMRGRSGVLHTGHWLLRAGGDGAGEGALERPGGAAGPLPGGADDGGASSDVDSTSSTEADRTAATEVGATSSTVVHFADLSDAEIADYVATGEPLAVAGAFTVDGLGGPFVTGIEGDYHGVVGLSLPLLRELLARLAVAITDLWAPRR
ncbi:Maf family protein [Georgenia sp. TF02-10]|uniref:Maf family protein n=1 Tax=Georgenia sp. TF02-10 TaxID=2917725 RepID=UPI001FA7BB58|nr:Maf family protein [Georgenia sp. TF02-10]UNX55680.1 Maf family protein [Georgenia sp. TF02-10]